MSFTTLPVGKHMIYVPSLNLVNYFEVIFRKCKLLENYNFAHTFYEVSI